MDVTAGSEIWNYPVFGYRRSSSFSDQRTEHVRTTVYYTAATTDNSDEPNYFTRTYTYTLHHDPEGAWSEWTGDSIHDHPDFAWRPTGRGTSWPTTGMRPGQDPLLRHVNPKLDPSIVSEILGYRV